MKRVGSQRGFSAAELLAALFIATALVLASVPPLLEAVSASKIRAAARCIAADVQQARSKAISTGWQYRIAGASTGATDGWQNQYRVMARSSTSIAWPDKSAEAFVNGTQRLGEWVDFDQIYPGVQLNPGDDGDFSLTFDARGVPVEVSLNFEPLHLVGARGEERSVRVSAVGGVVVD